jgi:exosortase/archaeosortase family protein
MSQVTDSYLEGKIYQKLILYAAIAFIVLPFMTTFNEFLTKVVESLHFVNAMQSVAAPFVVKTLAVILRAIGMPAAIDGSHLYLTGGWMPVKVYINWNCIGWQSFILLALTIVTGLQGPYTRRSKLITVLIGLEGTFVVNIVRILIPTLLAYHMGYIPAIIFHDYMGTLLTLLWIGGFWSYSFRNILVKRGGAEACERPPIDGPIQAMKKEGGKMVRDLDRGEA